MWSFCPCPNKSSAEILKPHGVAAHKPHKAFSSCAFKKCCYNQQKELSVKPFSACSYSSSSSGCRWSELNSHFPEWDRSVIFSRPVPFAMWAGDGAVVPSNLIQALVVLKFILSQSPPELFYLCTYFMLLYLASLT